MTFYILLPNDTKEDALYSSNILGEESFGNFYPEQGMQALLNIVNNKPELLEHIIIKDDHSKNYTLTEFFDKIKDLTVKKQRF